MNTQIIQKINQTNWNFYEQIAKYWNNDGNYAWDGWQKLDLEKKLAGSSKNQTAVKILDLGCGNGRFGIYLQNLFKPDKMEYLGLDFSDFYLEFNQKQRNLKNPTNQKFKFKKADFLDQNWDLTLAKDDFDIIVLFGVLHHIFDARNRFLLIEKASKLLKPGGYLIFTLWQFWKIPRLQKRILDLENLETQELLKKMEITKIDLESGDHLLNWVKKETAYRFAHKFEETEILQLIKISGLKKIAEYEDDDKTQNRNRYLVLRKEG